MTPSVGGSETRRTTTFTILPNTKSSSVQSTSCAVMRPPLSNATMTTGYGAKLEKPVGGTRTSVQDTTFPYRPNRLAICFWFRQILTGEFIVSIYAPLRLPRFLPHYVLNQCLRGLPALLRRDHEAVQQFLPPV